VSKNSGRKEPRSSTIAEPMNPITFLRAATPLAVIFMLLTGCATIVRERTLPPSIRSVYVPMAINRTAEIGLEERMTVAVQEELLADGRIEQARLAREADAIVRMAIVEYERVGFTFDSDDF